MNEFIENLKKELQTQDCRCTSDPAYLVEEKRRVYGLDPNYSDDYVWYDSSNQFEESDPAIIGQLEECEYGLSSGEGLENYDKVYYFDEWRYVQFFLTEKAAQEFIDKNKHRHTGELRIYTDSLYRNKELINVRNFFLNHE